MPHPPLITRAELPRYGVPSGFLAQFDVRPLQVSVDTAGALGVAAFKWRRLGESSWSQPVTSSPRGPWSWSPDRSFAVITFAAGAYVTTSTYTIDEDGTVTRSGAGVDTVTATRWDAVEVNIATVTDKATSKMQPRYTLPLREWGDAVKKSAAQWVKWLLKGDVGLAPAAIAAGDENIILDGQSAMAYFDELGQGEGKSPEITDSSSTGRGAGLMVGIASDAKAGF